VTEDRSIELPSYFWMTLKSVQPVQYAPLAFDIVFEHNTRRIARIHSAEFELWLPDRTTNIGRRLDALYPDIRADVTDRDMLFVPEFKGQQKCPTRLLWYHTPEQLQSVEEC
jgi:hypothetical protein